MCVVVKCFYYTPCLTDSLEFGQNFFCLYYCLPVMVTEHRQLCFLRGVQKLLNDPTLMQHIHNVSALKSDQLCPADMQDAEAMRKHHLEQQQEQFNKEIGQVQFRLSFRLL